MNRLAFLALAVACSLIVVAQKMPAGNDIKAEVQALYNDFSDAYVKEDIGRISKLVGKDFSGEGGEEKLGKDGFLKALQSGFDRATTEKLKIDVLTAEKEGDKVTVVIFEDGVMQSQAAPDRRTRLSQVTRDTLVKEDGKWVVTGTEMIGREFENLK